MLSEYPQFRTMWEQQTMNQPIVFRLDQKCGPVVERSLPRSERDWPLTLDDCQTMLIRILPRLKSERAGYREYWNWVGRTRIEMGRLYETHRRNCRLQQDWDLKGLWRLRLSLELLTIRLYCAPWLPARAVSPILAISQFSRLTA